MCQDCQDILEKKAKKGAKSGYYGIVIFLCQDYVRIFDHFQLEEKTILLISKTIFSFSLNFNVFALF